MKERTVKEIVSEFLGFLKYKVDTDAMCMEDVKALARAIMGGLSVRGTVEDFAGFYGKTTDNVRHILARKVAEKPRRKVTYTFSKFSLAVPASWHSTAKKSQENQPLKNKMS